ncbi:extensin family protein [Sphingomonas flavalba]|uniref:extensin family protein n=1 Tax=Sphingomonas flavalba TaxID=2559804 RepID=UPI0039E16D59
MAVVAALTLAACSGDRGRRSSARKPTPAAQLMPGITSAPIRQCLGRLAEQGVDFQPLPDRDFGGGCLAYGSVKLLDVGTPTTNLGAMTCPLASAFSGWVRFGVVPASRAWLGSEVVKVETFGTYNCRTINGIGATGRLSEHARSNAVDVAAFILADGRRISVKTDYRSADPGVRGFIKAVHQSACKRFATVLSPDYNAAHNDHFHLDMGRGPFCR